MSNILEQKYGIKETSEVKDFHRSRRMFCILNDTVHIAPEGVPYSHAQWFVNEGWMQSEETAFIDKTVRGIVDAKGDVYFYVGYNFSVSEAVEEIFFLHLKELQKLLNIKDSAHVYGGLVKQSKPGLWPPKKDYGTIKKAPKCLF